MIADSVRAGLGVREIAAQLGRSPSTIRRGMAGYLRGAGCVVGSDVGVDPGAGLSCR